MEDEQVEARAALVKFAAFAVVIAVVLALVTFMLVRALGLTGDTDDGSHRSEAATSTPSQLPTVAITSGEASASPTPSATPTPTPAQGIQLTAPAQAGAGSRVTLTGQYPGADGVTLQVQRMTGTTWGSFAGVTVTVHGGAFSTYIITSQRGAASFRLLDPTTGQASNVVQVTIG
ncbi:hypothetical protein D9V37_17250 [Nocardioides mangrovicus]|uniref:Uncharacterized protein n=1 Tax=Nocardioides mangrovicus TaxID=2478913 RepID=A0A3L8NY58_9ACTN|nr:hypothetical protein [Nocardioides mangrovicus]RLV47864.1 hypothetical protein D9V37_17250 [Nocardioides mangrovicus]